MPDGRDFQVHTWWLADCLLFRWRLSQSMKLLLIQSGIIAALAGLVLCAVPVHSWPSLDWRGRVVDDVNGFLTLPKEPAWIRQTNPSMDSGFNVSSLTLLPSQSARG